MAEFIRDEKGRWLPGSKPDPSPGRPRKDDEQRILGMLYEAFDEATYAAFVEQLRKQVMSGKFVYVKDLLRYMVPIKQTTAVTGADGQQLISAADVVAMIQAALTAKGSNGDNDGSPG